jgi:formyl-CoA transferase
VLSVPAALDPPQVAARGLLTTFDAVDGVDRPVRVARAGFRLASGDPGPATPPPALGADTADILAELGYAAGEIDALKRDGVV